MTTSLLVINPKEQSGIDSIKEYIAANKNMYDEVLVCQHTLAIDFLNEDYLKDKYSADRVIPINKFSIDLEKLDKNTAYDICGYDINYEVLASCFALADKDIKFRIMSNLVFTSKEQENKLPPNILLRCFSYSVI